MEELILAKPEKKGDVLKAQKSYDKMMEEIKPFIKKRRTSTIPPQKWEIASY